MEESQTEKNNDVVVLNKQDLTISLHSVKKELRKYWDRDYINHKINLIDNSKHKMLIRFLWLSGVRVSEAINVTKGEIDFENYVMRVKWLKNRKYNHRIVPIHPNLRNLLDVYTSSLLHNDKLFDISRQRAWQLTKKYLNGSPHQLRHSFAVNWLRCDGDLIILHRILGHSKVQTTMEYLKIVPIDQGKELIKIKFE